MKKIYIALSLFFLLVNDEKLHAQNVGIGTTTPSEKLSVAGNINANSFKYTSPKIFYYSVAESAFRARNGSETVSCGFGNGGAYIADGSNFGLMAPVNLPQNAKIIRMTVHFYDASATQDLLADLVNELSDTLTFVATITSSGNSGLNIQTVTLPTPFTVDNSISSYEMLVVPATGSWNTSELAIRSIIIQYAMDETN